MKNLGKLVFATILVVVGFAVSALNSNTMAAEIGHETSFRGTLVHVENNKYTVNGVRLNLYGVENLVGSEVNVAVKYDQINHFNVTSISKASSEFVTPSKVNYTNSYSGKLVKTEQEGYTHELENKDMRFSFKEGSVDDMVDKEVVVKVNRLGKTDGSFSVESVKLASEGEVSSISIENYEGQTRTYTGKLVTNEGGHTNYRLENMHVYLNLNNVDEKVGNYVTVTVEYTTPTNFRVVSVK